MAAPFIGSLRTLPNKKRHIVFITAVTLTSGQCRFVYTFSGTPLFYPGTDHLVLRYLRVRRRCRYGPDERVRYTDGRTRARARRRVQYIKTNKRTPLRGRALVSYLVVNNAYGSCARATTYQYATIVISE